MVLTTGGGIGEAENEYDAVGTQETENRDIGFAGMLARGCFE